MISVITELNKNVGIALASLSGLGGTFTGGGVTGHILSKKKSDLAGETDQEKKNLYHNILGSIPGVGAVTNAVAASRYYDQKEK